MSQPTPYSRGYSFRNFQTANPTTPLPGDKVDIEYNAIRITLDQTLANLALIQRDDGRIANGSIGVSQMDGSLISLGFERPTNWATVTAYVVDSAVFQNNKLYICLIAHTSSVFATDLANLKWVETIDFASLITDAEAARDLAQVYAAQAQAAALSISTSLLDYVNRDGSAAMTGALLLPSEAVLPLNAATVSQVRGTVVAHAAAVGGTADVITATFSPAFTAYANKMRFRFTASGANTVTAPTVDLDGLGPKTIKKLNGVALDLADIAGSGHVCECVYDGTNVLLLNFAPLTPAEASTWTAKQTFSAPVVHSETVLADAATIAWSLATGGPDYRVTIASNRTLGAFTGGTAGQEGILTVVQDATGNRSLDLSNAVYDFPGAFVQNIARGANDVTRYSYKVITANTAMELRRLGATTIGEGPRDLLSEQTASASATINFVLTKWLTLYDQFEVDLVDVLAATDNVALWMRTSTNAGGAYDAGATDYWTIWTRKTNGVIDGSGENTTAVILVSANGALSLGNVAGEGACGTVTVYKPAIAQRCKIESKITFINQGAVNAITQYEGVAIRDTAADVDAIRFLTASGNIASGVFRLYGIRK